MTATSFPAPLAAAAHPAAFARASVAASACVVLGLMWDISWHMSIGRDTFWSPPHMLIYLGAVVAGLAASGVIFRTTFGGSEADRAASVRVLGFRGPTGAFFCAWGAGAMLTSAPFDDWWHNAYGLDVKIISPPHAVLGLGMFAVQLGAVLATAALRGRARGEHADGLYPGLDRLYLGAAGLLLTMRCVMASEYSNRTLMHSAIFYQVACATLPVFLLAPARASGLRHAATATAAVYMAIYLGLLWLLPLFPAEPALGPVWQPVTSFVPLSFPLLLVFPALALDLVLRRFARWGEWRLSLVLGAAFLLVFLAVQWPFAEFLLSSSSRNWLFGSHRLPYFMPPDSYAARRQFFPSPGGAWHLARGLGVALLLAVLSSRLGLAWGSWMRRVQR